MGKNKSAPASKTDHLVIPNEIGTLHADIMHITHSEGAYVFLVGIDQQSGMTFAVLIRDSTKEEVEKGFDLIATTYLRYGHKLKQVHLDNESSFEAALVRKFLHSRGINTAPCPPGRHARRAEVQIRTIKSTFRALIMSLHYPFPIKLYPWAVRWAVESINITLKAGNDRITPFHAFTNQRTDLQRHLRVAFGDIVTTRLMSDEAARPKTSCPSQTFGIVLGREDNMRGTHIIMDLSSKSLIKRMHFKVYSRPNATITGRINSIGYGLTNTEFGHVIDSLNNIAAEDEIDGEEIDVVEEPGGMQHDVDNHDVDAMIPDSSESDESDGLADLSSDEDIESVEEASRPELITRRASLLARLRKNSTNNGKITKKEGFQQVSRGARYRKAISLHSQS